MAATDWAGFNVQKEEFCKQVMLGKNVQEAYRLATSRSVEKGSYQAYRWLNEDPWIVARLAELRREMQQDTKITLESHLSKLAELRDEAQASGRFGPAIAAEIARGKAAGLYVEKKEISVSDPSQMNREQLMKRLQQIESHKSKLIDLAKTSGSVGSTDVFALTDGGEG